MYIGLHVKYRCYSCQILIELEFCRQIFEKYSNIKFRENPSSVSRVVPCGRTDRQDKANSRFSQLCKRPYKLATSKHRFSWEIEENFHRNLQFVTRGIWKRRGSCV